MRKITVAPLLTTAWHGYRNVSIVRGDLLHPIVSGNKLYKLAPIFDQFSLPTSTVVISVGGRYSNHLHALAFAAHSHGMSSVGLVQGYPEQALTPTLKDCQRWGMKLHWLNKEEFSERYQPEFWQRWQKIYTNGQVILEGGWGELAIEGSRQWWSGIPGDTELVVTAVGSGTTLAGLALSAPKNIKVIGIPVFKDPEQYKSLRKKLASSGVKEHQYELWLGFESKKFGALSATQKEFANNFYNNHRIKLDPVYTTKVFYAVDQILQKDRALQGKKIAVLHTGGLQGLRK